MKKYILGLITAGLFSMPCFARAATIDLMTIDESVTYTYNPGGQFLIFGRAKEYFLNDGTSWSSGAGSEKNAEVDLQSVEILGSIIKYTFIPPSDGIIHSHADYNAGDHSSQGELGVAGPLVLEAELGSTTGMMSGYVEIISNEETYYGEPKFNYFSAAAGAFVRFSVTFTLYEAVWTENLFDESFTYGLTGYVDFTPPEKGDIDGDGHIDLRDSIKALQVVIGISPSMRFYSSNDVNGDNRVGIEEAIYTIQWNAGFYNKAPVLESIGDKTVDENSILIFTILANDPEDDDLTYGVKNLPLGASFDPDTRTFSWVPDYTQSGTYGVTFQVEDVYGNSDSEKITITVNDTPLFVASEYFPLNVGDWWDFKDDNTGNVYRLSVAGTKLVGGIDTKILAYPDGSKEYYSYDDNGLKLYGVYIIINEYTGDVIFNTPLLLMTNSAEVGTEQVSAAMYSVTVFVEGYGNVTIHVDITSTTKILSIEDITTENSVLIDCIKISRQITEHIHETGENMIGDTVYDWLYKGVGIVKESNPGFSITITESYVDGEHQNY